MRGNLVEPCLKSKRGRLLCILGAVTENISISREINSERHKADGVISPYPSGAGLSGALK